MDAVHRELKLSTLRSKPRGRTTNKAIPKDEQWSLITLLGQIVKQMKNFLPSKMIVLSVSVLCIPNIEEIIAGPRSPITTKKATQVPKRNPIIDSSTPNFPVDPNTWNAGRRINV